MEDLIILTKFDFERFINFEVMKGSHYSQIQLKNGEIILFEKFETKNIISVLHKNLKLNKIFECDDDRGKTVMNIIELSHNKILFCSKDLFLLNIKTNEIKKIEFPKEEKVLDIIKLKNKNILGITTNHLINININGEECTIKKLFDVPENLFLKENLGYEFLKQYLDLYEIPNNKLLIHSHSNGLTPMFCGNSIPVEGISNKICIFDLNNFSNIYNFDNFENSKTEINVVILDKYICISHDDIIDIYDINDYKLLKQINDNVSKKYIIKFDENLIIGLSYISKENNIIIYNLTNIDKISFKIYNGNFEFAEKKMQGWPLRFSKKKSISKLQNGSLLIICYGRLFIIKFPEQLKLAKFKTLNN